MVKEVREWWDAISKVYQESIKAHTKSAHYGPYAPDEDKLRLLGNVKGKEILELGCGGGQCSIAFAKQGAIATGIDISKEQLKYANWLAKKENVNVTFIEGDIQTLKGISSKKYDIAFSAFALQFVPELKRCFKEVYRVLKKKGLFVFSLGHPFWHVFLPKEQTFENGIKTFKIEKSYFDTGREEWWDYWSGKKMKAVIYRRKVSDIYNALASANFFIEKIIEPLELTQPTWSKDWEENYPPALVKLIGPTIIFKARKMKERVERKRDDREFSRLINESDITSRMVTVVIRPYRDTDFDDYAETLLQTWPCDNIQDARENVEQAVKRVKMNENEEIWVVQVNRKAVGFILLGFTRVWGHKGESFEEKAVGIDWFDVHPDFQRKGIGKALLQKAKERGKEQGLHRLFMHTSVKNLAMINFASKNGLRFAKYLEDFWGKGTGDAFLLVKDL